MRRQNAEFPQYALRLVENAKLPQHRPPVIVDSFARQTVIGVERVHPAKWDLDPPSGRGKTAPLPQMRTPNHDFDENSVVGDMPALYLNFQVGQRPDELLVKPADPVPAFIVLSPRLIIVPSGIAKGSENTFKVMLVFQSNVLLNNCDTRRPRVFVSISRNRCAGHMHLRSRSPQRGSSADKILPPAKCASLTEANLSAIRFTRLR